MHMHLHQYKLFRRPSLADSFVRGTYLGPRRVFRSILSLLLILIIFFPTRKTQAQNLFCQNLFKNHSTSHETSSARNPLAQIATPHPGFNVITPDSLTVHPRVPFVENLGFLSPLLGQRRMSHEYDPQVLEILSWTYQNKSTVTIASDPEMASRWLLSLKQRFPDLKIGYFPQSVMTDTFQRLTVLSNYRHVIIHHQNIDLFLSKIDTIIDLRLISTFSEREELRQGLGMDLASGKKQFILLAESQFKAQQYQQEFNLFLQSELSPEKDSSPAELLTIPSTEEINEIKKNSSLETKPTFAKAQQKNISIATATTQPKIKPSLSERKKIIFPPSATALERWAEFSNYILKHQQSSDDKDLFPSSKEYFELRRWIFLCIRKDPTSWWKNLSLESQKILQKRGLTNLQHPLIVRRVLNRDRSTVIAKHAGLNVMTPAEQFSEMILKNQNSQNIRDLFPDRQANSELRAWYKIQKEKFPDSWWKQLDPKAIQVLETRHATGSFYEALRWQNNQLLNQLILRNHHDPSVKFILSMKNAGTYLKNWLYEERKNHPEDWWKGLSSEAIQILMDRQMIPMELGHKNLDH